MSSLVLTVCLVPFRSHLRLLRPIPTTTIHASMKWPLMSIRQRKLFFNEADLEELDIPLEAEADDQPSIVLICFVAMLLNPSSSLLSPLFSFIFPLTVE